MDKIFIIDRKAINDEFQQPQYEEFRQWYFKNYNKKQLQKFKKEFYDFIEKEKQIFPFVKWFTTNYSTEIAVLEQYQRTWQKKDGTSISSTHPPFVPIVISYVTKTGHAAQEVDAQPITIH